MGAAPVAVITGRQLDWALPCHEADPVAVIGGSRSDWALPCHGQAAP